MNGNFNPSKVTVSGKRRNAAIKNIPLVKKQRKNVEENDDWGESDNIGGEDRDIDLYDDTREETSSEDESGESEGIRGSESEECSDYEEDVETDDDEDAETSSEEEESESENDFDYAAYMREKRSQKKRVTKPGSTTTFKSDAVHFYLGNLPSRLSLELKEKLKSLFAEKGVNILDIRGRIGKKFCHCTINSEFKEKLEAMNGNVEFNGSTLKLDISVGGLVDKRQEKEIEESKFEKIDFFIGLQENFTEEVWQELLKLFPEKGVKLLEIRGLGGKKFCHCTLADPNDKEKMVALNGTEFHGKPLAIDLTSSNVSQSQRKDDFQNNPHVKKVGLRQVNHNVVTVEALKEHTGAVHAHINIKNSKAYVYFSSTRKATTLLSQKTLTVDECTMYIEQGVKPSSQSSAGGNGKFGRFQFQQYPGAISNARAVSTCVNCDGPGHYFKDCPKPVRCRYCKKFEGHIARDCPEKANKGFQNQHSYNRSENTGARGGDGKFGKFQFQQYSGASSQNQRSYDRSENTGAGGGDGKAGRFQFQQYPGASSQKQRSHDRSENTGARGGDGKSERYQFPQYPGASPRKSFNEKQERPYEDFGINNRVSLE